MTNLDATKSLCNAIVNTFYPDSATVRFVLASHGISPDGEATPTDKELFCTAVRLVMGFVESSRSENGVSTAVREDAIRNSIKYWCGVYGVDADEVLGGEATTIEDGTHLW